MVQGVRNFPSEWDQIFVFLGISRQPAQPGQAGPAQQPAGRTAYSVTDPRNTATPDGSVLRGTDWMLELEPTGR